MGKGIQCCFQRYEKKYLLTPAQHSRLTAALAGRTRPDEYGQYTICNVYYDTDHYDLIRTSLEKPVYKEKLRVRSYGTPGDGDQVFVELKKKFDGVVYKRRTVLPVGQAAAYLNEGVRPAQADQICREIDWFLASYRPVPKVFIAYDRVALAGLDDPELRFTFDTGLRWRDTDLDLRAGDHGAPILSGDQVLMEVKLPGAAPLWLSHLLSQLEIYPTSFSKYGMCYKENLARPVLGGRKGARFCA